MADPSTDRVELISYGRPEVGGLLRLSGKEVELSSLEFELVERLLQKAERSDDHPISAFVSVDELASMSWNSTEFTVNQLRVLIFRLRNRLAEAGLPDLIENKRSIGYRLAPALIANLHRDRDERAASEPGVMGA